jgi:hypothetical protein
MSASMRHVLAAMGVLLIGAGVVRADEGIAGDEARPPGAAVDQGDINLGFADADEEVVANLVAQLGAFEYDRREAASAALRKLGPSAFRVMARAYRATNDDEVRSRIADIARSQFLWHTLLKRRGFLGIGYQPANMPTGSEMIAVVQVQRVEPGSAAAEEGLQPGDLVISIDGQPIHDANQDEEFRDVIEQKGAGGQVVLQILRHQRGGPPLSLRKTVTLRARPLHQYADTRNPELLESLDRQIQAFNIWWNEYFSVPEPKRDRMPSSSIFDLPD